MSSNPYWMQSTLRIHSECSIFVHYQDENDHPFHVENSLKDYNQDNSNHCIVNIRLFVILTFMLRHPNPFIKFLFVRSFQPSKLRITNGCFIYNVQC